MSNYLQLHGVVCGVLGGCVSGGGLVCCVVLCGVLVCCVVGCFVRSCCGVAECKCAGNPYREKMKQCMQDCSIAFGFVGYQFVTVFSFCHTKCRDAYGTLEVNKSIYAKVIIQDVGLYH